MKFLNMNVKEIEIIIYNLTDSDLFFLNIEFGVRTNSKVTSKQHTNTKLRVAWFYVSYTASMNI